MLHGSAALHTPGYKTASTSMRMRPMREEENVNAAQVYDHEELPKSPFRPTTALSLYDLEHFEVGDLKGGWLYTTRAVSHDG